MDRTAIEDLFAPVGEVTLRRMFGGIGFYRQEFCIAFVYDGTIWFKTDAITRSTFEDAGSTPFRSRRIQVDFNQMRKHDQHQILGAFRFRITGFHAIAKCSKYQKKSGEVSVMSFWMIPEVCFDDEETLKHFTSLAETAARRAATVRSAQIAKTKQRKA